MRTEIRSLSLAFIAATGIACSSTDPGTSGSDSGSSADDLAMAALDLSTLPPDFSVTVPPGYPPGPYGGAVGDTVQSLTFNGYFSPTMTTGLATAQPYGIVTFDQARKAPGAKLMMVMLAGFT